jgi:hypothetical protein
VIRVTPAGATLTLIIGPDPDQLRRSVLALPSSVMFLEPGIETLLLQFDVQFAGSFTVSPSDAESMACWTSAGVHPDEVIVAE